MAAIDDLEEANAAEKRKLEEEESELRKLKLKKVNGRWTVGTGYQHACGKETQR